MARYSKKDPRSSEDARQLAILRYLDENRGGRDATTIMKALSIGGIDLIRRTLNVMEMKRYVNVVNGSYKYAHGGNRTKFFHITPDGVDRLYVLRGDVPAEAEEWEDDWSATPALMPSDGGGAQAVPVAVPVPVPVPVAEREEDTAAEVADTAEEAAPVPAEDMDMDALGRALDTLRALSVGVDDIDFDIGALTSRIESRIKSSISPCPHCGGAMEWQSVGDNRMLVCKGCCLAVTWKKNPKDMTGLVRAWNKRVRYRGREEGVRALRAQDPPFIGRHVGGGVHHPLGPRVQPEGRGREVADGHHRRAGEGGEGAIPWRRRSGGRASAVGKGATASMPSTP